MALFDTPFYHETIRLYHGVFGKIFDNLKVVRPDGTQIKVPLSWAGKQHYNVRVDQNPHPEQITHRMRLPRMSYHMIGLARDPTRNTNRYNTMTQQGLDRQTAENATIQYNRVPHNFMFELNIKTKYYEDMLSLIEQILVYFNPEITVNIKDNPDLNMASDLIISLEGNELTDMYEGMIQEDRVVEKTLTFIMQGYLYMPSQTMGIIKRIDLNYHDLDFPERGVMAHDVVLPDEGDE